MKIRQRHAAQRTRGQTDRLNRNATIHFGSASWQPECSRGAMKKFYYPEGTRNPRGCSTLRITLYRASPKRKFAAALECDREQHNSGAG
jgi:hypothetical protein